MFLAGVPLKDQLVVELLHRLRRARLDATAETLRLALDARALVVALEAADREAIVRVLDDPPAPFTELRDVLVSERVARRGDGAM